MNTFQRIANKYLGLGSIIRRRGGVGSRSIVEGLECASSYFGVFRDI
jgi:hypothetical protein